MKTKRIDNVDTAVDAHTFFANHVSKRRPAVVKGLPDDAAFKARNWTDLTYLTSKAGKTQVKVEPIHLESQQYGTDVDRISMPFGEFLDSLKSREGPHPYLTTQYTEEDPERQTFIPPPASALIDDFPMVPRLMGNLFLQQVNLWLGKSQDGSSSGLHHDFHDNLYCLLQGRKRFVLYPPQEITNLCPYGKLDTLHPNGLISYKDGPVRSDGLPIRVALHTRIKAIERKLESLPKGKGKNKALSKERKALMKAHDEALDELAQYTLDEGGKSGMDEEVDDFDALMSGLDERVEEGDGTGPSGQNLQSDGEGTETEDEDNKSLVLGDEDESGWEDEESDEPSHFSKIPTAILHKHLGVPTTAVSPPDASLDDFPSLRKATAPFVVELNAGEMLYLPASWWHEVTSTSSADGDGIHMAFNYWFYPPTSSDFDAPYEDALVWGYFRERAKDGADPNPNKPLSQEEAAEGSKRRNDESAPGSKKKTKR